MESNCINNKLKIMERYLIDFRGKDIIDVIINTKGHPGASTGNTSLRLHWNYIEFPFTKGGMWDNSKQIPFELPIISLEEHLSRLAPKEYIIDFRGVPDVRNVVNEFTIGHCDDANGLNSSGDFEYVFIRFPFKQSSYWKEQEYSNGVFHAPFCRGLPIITYAKHLELQANKKPSVENKKQETMSKKYIVPFDMPSADLKAGDVIVSQSGEYADYYGKKEEYLTKNYLPKEIVEKWEQKEEEIPFKIGDIVIVTEDTPRFRKGEIFKIKDEQKMSSGKPYYNFFVLPSTSKTGSEYEEFLRLATEEEIANMPKFKSVKIQRETGGDFELVVHNDGRVVFAEDGAVMKYDDVKNIFDVFMKVGVDLRKSNSASCYYASVHTISIGCKKGIPLPEFHKIKEAYDSLQ